MNRFAKPNNLYCTFSNDYTKQALEERTKRNETRKKSLVNNSLYSRLRLHGNIFLFGINRSEIIYFQKKKKNK